jgi:hypothetical protein
MPAARAQIRFHSGNRLHQHSLGFIGRAELARPGRCAKAADESVRTAVDAAAIINVRTMDSSLFRNARGEWNARTEAPNHACKTK